MNIYTAISLGLAIAGFVGGILTAIFKLAIKTGRLLERFNTHEKRDDEEREKNHRNFDEIYTRMRGTESDVTAVQSIVTELKGTCSRIENKLDRFIERGAQ